MILELVAMTWLATATRDPAQAAAPRESEPAARMFESMLGLAGEWDGSFEWTDGRSGSGPMRARYTVTGAGSALAEDLINPEGTVVMSTVYHLDGAELRMSHFCAAHNQPRLKASRFAAAPAAAEFAIVDVTGKTQYGYVQAFRIEIVDEDTLYLRFTFAGNPKTSGTEHVKLKRIRAARA